MKPRTQLLLRFAGAAVVTLVCIFALFQFLSKEIFRVQNVEIEAEDLAAHGSIFPKIKESLDLRLMPLQGKYVWNVDLEKVLKTVEGDLRIRQAQVSRVLPNTIRITVAPHTPIASILTTTSSRFYPLARDGEVLPPVAPEDAADAIILRGEIFIKDKTIRMNAVDLLLSLEAEGILSHKTVSDIQYDKKKGFELRMQASGTVLWIGFDNFKLRLKNAYKVLDYLDREQLAGRIIDARYGKKVVVKLRNEP